MDYVQYWYLSSEGVIGGVPGSTLGSTLGGEIMQVPLAKLGMLIIIGINQNNWIITLQTIQLL